MLNVDGREDAVIQSFTHVFLCITGFSRDYFRKEYDGSSFFTDTSTPTHAELTSMHAYTYLRTHSPLL